ncbi:M15 family metallopeptidase [Microbacterium sp. M3]|uniref:M15 family metallopeptidase n=1 Tax=Microbacterium arthrosphaerae TaxID=792652 RepID=A0ABU4H6I1_9MICO|nr:MULTISPECIES: M15 family metallopeptidase [Microbacterium]MDW4574265.1 M15 family metallopeptidase [Microbacterium arthrosphaerae]MDW7608120.1 M15 family metallopeptidase [Microbacterium sp. M3]
MSSHTPHNPASRRLHAAAVASAAVVFAVVVTACTWPASAREPAATAPSAIAADTAGSVPGALPALEGSSGAVLAEDGGVADGTTVFDDVPAVSRLQPQLLEALRRAAADASASGIAFVVNSGWRSRDHQDRLLRDAIAEYGSAEEAARWVATPDTSPHVSGSAIDIGGTDATDWLAARGARFGLCQIYANEPWHYELRPEAVGSGCPAVYPDPTYDPRMKP